MPRLVTNKMAARMKELRAAGMTYLKIAAEMDLAVTTVMRHVDPHHAEKQRQHEADRYYRNKKGSQT